MRLLSLFVDFALNPLEGKQVRDLGALLPAIAALSQDLPARHAVASHKAHSNSFDILRVLQEEDANRIKVDCVKKGFLFWQIASVWLLQVLNMLHNWLHTTMCCVQNMKDNTSHFTLLHEHALATFELAVLVVALSGSCRPSVRQLLTDAVLCFFAAVSLAVAVLSPVRLDWHWSQRTQVSLP